MPAAGLLSNAMHGRFMRLKVPYALWASLFPGSWLGGSWVSALLIGGFFFTPSSRSCCDVWLVFVLLSARSLRIHWHTSCLSSLERVYCLEVLFFVCLVLWFVFFGLLLGCFWFCFLSAPPAGRFGLRNGTLSLDSPKRDVAVLCTIRTMAQTLCYDLARAEKAKDGKNLTSKATNR